MQFSPTFCHFIPLWSKHYPRHPVHKCHQFMKTVYRKFLKLLYFLPSLYLQLCSYNCSIHNRDLTINSNNKANKSNNVGSSFLHE
jgi:hypothetical protein